MITYASDAYILLNNCKYVVWKLAFCVFDSLNQLKKWTDLVFLYWKSWLLNQDLIWNNSFDLDVKLNGQNEYKSIHLDSIFVLPIWK